MPLTHGLPILQSWTAGPRGADDAFASLSQLAHMLLGVEVPRPQQPPAGDSLALSGGGDAHGESLGHKASKGRSLGKPAAKSSLCSIM